MQDYTLEQLNRAKELARAGRYTEAKRIVGQLDHPKRAEWLEQIHRMEQKARTNQSGSSGATSLTGSQPARLDSQPVAARQPSSTATPTRTGGSSQPGNLKPGKPLPLLPEEERQALPRGKPQDPWSLIRAPYPVRGRSRSMMLLFGAKAGPLINNYWKMKKSLLAGFFLIAYISLFIAWFPAFGILFVTGEKLFETGSTNFVALAISAALVLLLPLFPRVIAWVQEAHYQQWVREYEVQVRGFTASKTNGRSR